MSRLLSPAYMHPLLPPWLRRFFLSERMIATQHAAGLYAAEFREARERSANWGLHPSSFDPLPVRYASPSTVATVRDQLNKSIGHLSADIAATQRFGITASVRSELEAGFKSPVAYTVGYVQQNGQRLCHTSIEGLEQMLRIGTKPGAQVDLHAWLTLQSHEIVDLSFWAMFPSLACADEIQERGLFMHPDQMPGRSYHPQWVGEGFVRGTGILKEYEGW